MIPPGWSYRQWFSIPDDYYGAPGPDDDVLIADRWDGLAHIDPRARMYLQDLGLFVAVGDEIRACFNPSDDAKALIYDDDAFPAVLADSVVLHVRRGDTVTQPAGYQPLATLAYYEAALARTEGPVVIFSDDPRWCETTFERVDALDGRLWAVIDHGSGRSHKPNLYRRQPARDWLDLQTMAYGVTFIISNSTYAWWAAWLSGSSEVYYPEVWWGENLAYIDSDLMIPDGWTRVPC